MLIQRLEVRGFKSLVDVSLDFTDLTVLVGPNGAGKSNLAHSIGFLSDVYAIGVSEALLSVGGIENILSGRSTRGAASLAFSVLLVPGGRFSRKRLPRNIALRHTFSLRRTTTRLGFRVLSEQIELIARTRGGKLRPVMTMRQIGRESGRERV
jgi:predicted ATPase